MFIGYFIIMIFIIAIITACLLFIKRFSPNAYLWNFKIFGIIFACIVVLAILSPFIIKPALTSEDISLNTNSIINTNELPANSKEIFSTTVASNTKRKLFLDTRIIDVTYVINKPIASTKNEVKVTIYTTEPTITPIKLGVSVNDDKNSLTVMPTVDNDESINFQYYAASTNLAIDSLPPFNFNLYYFVVIEAPEQLMPELVTDEFEADE